jgi:hypothetical protein
MIKSFLKNYRDSGLSYQFLLLFLVTIIFSCCTASRSVIHSGKVTPQGDFKAGANLGGKIPTQTIGAMANVKATAVQDVINRDSIQYDKYIDNLSKVLLAYSLDPLNVSADFYIRYGIYKKFDIGYKYFSGAHVFDAMYQFMGSTGTINNPGQKGINASIGIQYASQKSDLPEKLYLDKLSSFMEFTASRKDILIPLVFSMPFGDEEEYGHLGYGLVYNHTFLEYGFQPERVFTSYVGNYANVEMKPITNKKNFSSFGGFVNAKIGYKYVYFLGSLSVYYQDYGKYEIPGGETIKFSGFTFIPTAGLQFHIHSGKGSKSASE